MDFEGKLQQALVYLKYVAKIIRDKYAIDFFHVVETEDGKLEYRGQPDATVYEDNSPVLLKRALGLRTLFHYINEAIWSVVRVVTGTLGLIFGLVVFLALLIGGSLVSALVCGPVLLVGALGAGCVALTCAVPNCCVDTCTCGCSVKIMHQITRAFMRPFTCMVEGALGGAGHIMKQPFLFYESVVKSTWGMVFA